MKNFKKILTEKYNTTKFNKPGSSFDYVEEDINERLYGKQHKLDKNKNGRLDSEDFKMLRSKKERNEGNWPMEEETIYELEINDGEMCECGSGLRESECTECGKMNERLYGRQHELDLDDDGDIDKKDFKELRRKKLKKEIDEMDSDSETIYELELEEDEFDNARKTEGFWNPGKKTFNTKMYEYEIFNKNLGKSVRLTEEQVVNLIETLAEEKLKPAKKTRGYSEYEKSHNKSGKENEDYYKEVAKKMKDYMKDGSMEDFKMDTDHFPMGNGELKKMDKMAYIPSDSVAEYVENFTAAALENLDYDEIGPNEEWVENNIVGSSKTGNNPKWANAVETPTNKKRNEIREKNLLAMAKRKAYNKSAQPIVKDRTGSDDASDLLDKLDHGGSKKSKKINEDLERIGNLISYNRKTQ